MGLLKPKKINGHDNEYHRIMQMNMNYDRLDCVIDVGLYKDELTRNDDETAVVDTYKVDIGSYFHNENYNNGEDTMKNVSLKEAYKALDKMAKAEEAKRADLEDGETLDEGLAFYADATQV